MLDNVAHQEGGEGWRVAGGGCRLTRSKRRTQLANRGAFHQQSEEKCSSSSRSEKETDKLDIADPSFGYGYRYGYVDNTSSIHNASRNEASRRSVLGGCFWLRMPMIGHAYAKRVRRSGLRSLGGLTMTLGSSRSWSTSQVDRKVEEFRD